MRVWCVRETERKYESAGNGNESGEPEFQVGLDSYIVSPLLAFFPHSHFPLSAQKFRENWIPATLRSGRNKGIFLSYWNGLVCNRSMFSSLPTSWSLPAFPPFCFELLCYLTWGDHVFVLLIMSVLCPEFYFVVVLLINNSNNHSFHLLKVYFVKCFMYILI